MPATTQNAPKLILPEQLHASATLWDITLADVRSFPTTFVDAALVRETSWHRNCCIELLATFVLLSLTRILFEYTACPTIFRHRFVAGPL